MKTLAWICVFLVPVFLAGAILLQKSVNKEPNYTSKHRTLLALMISSFVASIVSLIIALAILVHEHPMHKKVRA